MAKRKLGVSLSPIAVQVAKAEKKLRALKKKVAVAERKQVDLEIKDLQTIKGLVLKACGGRMTKGFLPAGPGEE